MTEIENKLNDLIDSQYIKINEPLSKHTSFKIGGPADYYLTPSNEVELIKLLDFLESNKLPYYIMGGGNNLLVSDKGFRGTIIDLSRLNTIEVNENIIKASCGAKLRDISKKALENSLGGYEFASGIPGTLGGAVSMNAGAYGGEHKNVIESVRYYQDGQIKEVPGDECEFGYRQSIFKKNGSVILSAKIKLNPDDQDLIKKTIDDLTKRRIEKQPLNFPSAGSIFKRPENNFAGKLIQDNGFKGYSIGGAQVSEKHAGFIVNTGEATAQDVLDLIHLIQKTVKENNDIDLETEVIFIGDSDDETNP